MPISLIVLIIMLSISRTKALSSTMGKHGYEFYEAIGRPRFISAPMVDQSSLAWRLLVKKNGADLAFTQMHHARNFVTDKRYREDCIDWEDYSHSRGDKALEAFARELDSNLIVQLAGDDPDVLVRAGKLVENSANIAAFDLNLGCPQKIAKRGNYGAYLLRDRPLVLRCLKAMVRELGLPVTAKIRRLASDEDTLSLCRAIEDCGVSMLTVHGRTVENSKLYITEADWDIIRRVKASLSIPVIANGGISCRADALSCLEFTGADGVMSSEALLENPKLFSERGDQFFQSNYIESQIQTAKEYLDLVLSYPLPRPLNNVVRGHLFKFLFRFVDAPASSDLRSLLAEGNFDDMQRVVKMVDERMATVNYDMVTALERGLLNNRIWYMRHRDERSMHRVISPRRVKQTVVSSKTEDELKAERVAKLEVLRKRLEERKRISALIRP